MTARNVLVVASLAATTSDSVEDLEAAGCLFAAQSVVAWVCVLFSSFSLVAHPEVDLPVFSHPPRSESLSVFVKGQTGRSMWRSLW